ncbi:hypothetical protein NEUTE1DRAFT_41557, partial [Neurospora tetrasperma FGSC 2508]
QEMKQQQEKRQHPTKGFVDIVEYHKPGLGGREVTIHPTSRFIPQNSLSKRKKRDYKYEDHAVVLRRTWMEHHGVSLLVRIELEIHSKPLCSAFRRIAARRYASTDLTSHPIKLPGPFIELFFYRTEIRALAETTSDPDLRRAARALDEFVHRPDGVVESIIQDHERYSKEGHVLNDILWTIYPPNSLAVLDNGVFKECWLIRDVVTETNEMGMTFWVVVGLRLDYDGSSPGLARQSFRTPVIGIRPQKISNLSLIPIQNYADWQKLRGTLLTRSKQLTEALGVDFSSFRCQSYSGPSWDRKSAHPSGKHHDQENLMLSATQVDERFIMDFKAISSYRNITLEDLKSTSISTESSRFKKQISNPMPRGFARDWGIEPKDIKPSRKDDDSSSDSDSSLDSSDLEFLDTALKQEHAVDLAAFPAQARSSFEVETAGDEQPKREKANFGTINGVVEAAAKKFKVEKSDVELLFPALVPVFGLKSKSWRWALADKLQDVKWNMTAFRSLQLDQLTKNLIQGLVKGHKDKKVVFDDIIEGKGQGLIFLLHGKPGLGKTLTAGGELGTEVSAVEKKLQEIFERVKRWGAVTLLDEADVLLCKRSSAEMQRNAVVAVFLRMLEYFQGVLFLTTNRKQDFDDAFKSRIHVTISYPKLSSEAKSQIWESLISTNKSVETDASWTKAVYTALGKLNLNGRTIKNILRTAVAYANSEGKPLGARHVLAMLRTELQGNGDEGSDDEDNKLKDGVHDSLSELHTILDIPF